MQSLRSLLATAAAVFWTTAAHGLPAQEPTPTPPGSETPPAAEGASEERPARGQRRGGRQGQGRGEGRGGRQAWTVIEAGHVHPVVGPEITNGVIVIRGERILAVGQQGELQLPPNTTVHRFPDAHVYPGLVDAETDAYTDRALQADGTMNGGSKIADALVWTDSPADRLIENGITTAYVAVRSPAQVRGQGAIVRPRQGGFDVWEGKEQAGLELRLAQPARGSHPLQRLQAIEGTGRLFDGLDQYREAQEKFEEELEKYEKDFAAYLEHHQKKNGQKGPGEKADGDKPDGDKAEGEAKGEQKPAESGETPGAEGRRGRRGRGQPPREDGGELVDVTLEQFEALARVMALLAPPDPPVATDATAGAAQDPRGRRRGPQGQGGDAPQGQPADGGAKPEAAKDGDKKDDGPKRPEYPKKPTPDPQKDVLLKVLDGELPLRVEAHRPEELRAALAIQREHQIPLLVVEQAYGADRVAAKLAEQGARAVLTDVLPHSLAPAGADKDPMADFDPTALPVQLQRAGVPFAIATGGGDLSGMLPLMAAAAVGRGLAPDAALRAITLTPAEILGVDADTGSLSRGKFADVLVTSGPLFASDSRVLLVLSKGRTEYEAK